MGRLGPAGCPFVRQLPPLYSWAEGGAHGRKGPSASLLFSLWWRQVLVWVLARTYLLARLCLYICIMRWRKTSNVSSFCSGPSAPRPSPSERVPLQNRGDSQNQDPGSTGVHRTWGSHPGRKQQPQDSLPINRKLRQLAQGSTALNLRPFFM